MLLTTCESGSVIADKVSRYRPHPYDAYGYRHTILSLRGATGRAIRHAVVKPSPNVVDLRIFSDAADAHYLVSYFGNRWALSGSTLIKFRSGTTKPSWKNDLGSFVASQVTVHGDDVFAGGIQFESLLYNPRFAVIRLSAETGQ